MVVVVVVVATVTAVSAADDEDADEDHWSGGTVGILDDGIVVGVVVGDRNKADEDEI